MFSFFDPPAKAPVSVSAPTPAPKKKPVVARAPPKPKAKPKPRVVKAPAPAPTPGPEPEPSGGGLFSFFDAPAEAPVRVCVLSGGVMPVCVFTCVHIYVCSCLGTCVFVSL